VILDGENCWEYYPQDGLPFLRALYRRLSSESWIQTVRASDYLDQHGETSAPLARLWTGSWINANFSIWIGHREDNQAWDALHDAHLFIERYLENHPDQAESPAVRQAWEEIYTAEGSDWCWWYGDDHSSANDETFDYLFRKHLINVYTLLGARAPEALHLAIKGKRVEGLRQAPGDFIQPVLDGKITNYFEWQPAGRYIPGGGGTGTMHRVEHWLKSHHYGFSKDSYYFRFDFTASALQHTKDLVVKIIFIQPEGHLVTLPLQDTAAQARFQALEPIQSIPVQAQYLKILEAQIPVSSLSGADPSGIQYLISIESAGKEIERWPSDQPITMPYPSIDVFAENWSA
jgi:hypothetical protein